MKAPFAVSISVAIAASVSAAVFYYQSAASKSTLATYEAHVQQLLSQAEENSRERIEQNELIEELRSDLNAVQSQLTATADQLSIAEAQSDPDYELIETEIRRQVIREYADYDTERQVSERVRLIQDLAQLDPIELGELMSVHGQFGPFLQALDVSDERMEIIVESLTNIISSQNTARQEIFEAAQNGDIGRRDMRTQLAAIMNPENLFEDLSYDLTENEIAVLQQVQEEQRSQTATGTFSFQSGTLPLSMSPRGIRQGGAGISIAQPITPQQ